MGEEVRVSHCPECGYSLEGLQGAGRCPECGREYDSSREVVIFGWGSGGKMRRYNMVDAGSWGWWFKGFPSAWVGILIYNLIMHGGRVAWEKFVMAAIAYGILSCIALYRRSRLVHLPGPVLAQASREGFGQRNGVGKVVMNPWDGGDEVKIEPAGEGRYRLVVWRRRPTQVGRGDSVDIVFDGDEAMAGRCREMMEGFRRGVVKEVG